MSLTWKKKQQNPYDVVTRADYTSGDYHVRRRGPAGANWWAYFGREALGYGKSLRAAKDACERHAAKAAGAST